MIPKPNDAFSNSSRRDLFSASLFRDWHPFLTMDSSSFVFRVMRGVVILGVVCGLWNSCVALSPHIRLMLLPTLGEFADKQTRSACARSVRISSNSWGNTCANKQRPTTPGKHTQASHNAGPSRLNKPRTKLSTQPHPSVHPPVRPSYDILFLSNPLVSLSNNPNPRTQTQN